MGHAYTKIGRQSAIEMGDGSCSELPDRESELD